MTQAATRRPNVLASGAREGTEQIMPTQRISASGLGGMFQGESKSGEIDPHPSPAEKDNGEQLVAFAMTAGVSIVMIAWIYCLFRFALAIFRWF